MIRSWLDDFALPDGGILECAHHPETAWQPCPHGITGFFRRG